jgi:P-type Mg2+ transporter
MQKQSDDVLLDAYLIAHFQTGLRNVLDRAVLKYREVHEKFPIEESRKIDEIPFDFSRRMMSVVVEAPNQDHRLLTKGAPESVFPRCSFYELEGKIHPMEPILVGDLMSQYQELSSDGFRVLAVAYKHLEPRSAYSKDDESELILEGYVAFLDPPKETAPMALAALSKIGVTVKVLTGDNDLVTRKICKEVGLPVDKLVLGSQIETMTDEELTASAEQVHVFARVSPAHKQRIIRVLQQKQHVVGFMGDGINGAPALRVADVGISVDTGVDIAKELATVILLEKSLMVLEEGVIEAERFSSISSNTFVWEQVPTSATCSAFLAPVPSCPMCRWHLCKCSPTIFFTTFRRFLFRPITLG